MQEIARRTHSITNDAATPTVWILSKGEMHEGGTIIAVFLDRDLARGQFAHEANNMAFGIDNAEQREDGSVHLEAGCDWLALEPHPVVTRQQLT